MPYSRSGYVRTTVDGNSDCLILKADEYYAKEDCFFPLRLEKPQRSLIKKVTGTCLHSKQDKEWMNGCGVAMSDVQT